MAEAATPSPSKTSIGIDENLAGVLAYFFAPLSSILLIVMEKNSKSVKFHAYQSLGLVVAWFVITFGYSFSWFLPDFLSLLVSCALSLLGLATFALWIFLMWKAYNNEMYKLPVIGDFAEKQANK